MQVKERNVVLMFLGLVALNAPFIILWATMLGVDACRLSKKDPSHVKYLSYVSMGTLVVVTVLTLSGWVTFHDDAGTLESPFLFWLAIVSALSCLVSLLSILIIANSLITKAAGGVAGLAGAVKIIALSMFAFALLPYLQVRLNTLIRSARSCTHKGIPLVGEQ